MLRPLILVLTLCLTQLIGFEEARGSSLPKCPEDQSARYHMCFGTYIWKDGKWKGDKYVGEYKDGKMHGQGTYYYLADNKFKGDKYVGEYKDDKRNGQGTFYFLADNKNKGSKYAGELKDGNPNGQGTFTYASGEKYVGEFKDGKRNGQGIWTYADGRAEDCIFENDEEKSCKPASPKVAKVNPNNEAAKAQHQEALRQAAEEKRKRQAAERRLADLQAKEAARNSAEAKPKPTPQTSTSTSGSGFFVSKTGHVITNQHVVADCKKVTVGDKADKQVQADVLEKDARNDLALLKISSLKMASADTKSLIQKLGIKIVPLASGGLLRSEDLELGEDVLVAGYPYGEIFSNTIKVTKGIVSANRGLGDDTAQFQIDAAVQPGNSGGPIYDENGNVVGVVVAQLNKRKFEKIIGSMPENVNFGIKASTVRQFLTSSGLPTKWSDKSKPVSTKHLAKIAKRQTVMVVCHQ